jgi:hypothetical protein
MLTQASPGVPGTPEPGDHFGASLAQAWVGVPGERLGHATARAHLDEWGEQLPMSVSGDLPRSWASQPDGGLALILRA